MKKIDMHLHTTFSDGAMDVKEVINEARNNNCSLISITDHEVLNDYSYLNESFKDIDIINGIEFNTSEKGVHILGYKIEDVDYINDFIDNLHKDNEHVSFELIDALKKSGYNISNEQVSEYIKSIGLSYKYLDKRHIVRYLVDNNYTESVYDTYANLIGSGTRLYIPLKKIAIEDIISLIKTHSGIAVLAHPSTMNKSADDLLDTVNKLKMYGLDGLEIFNRKSDKKYIKLYNDIADECDLIKTVGSDFHSFNDDEIGINVDNDFYEKIKIKLM